MLLAVEIGERAGDLEDAVEAAGREPHGVGRLAHEGEAVPVGTGDLLDQRRRAGGVGGDALDAERGEALRLHPPRRGDAPGDLGRAFGGAGRMRSAALTEGTSMTRSMRSISGPERRAWYCAMQ